jgi:hypothetical protein
LVLREGVWFTVCKEKAGERETEAILAETKHFICFYYCPERLFVSWWQAVATWERWSGMADGGIVKKGTGVGVSIVGQCMS